MQSENLLKFNPRSPPQWTCVMPFGMLKHLQEEAAPLVLMRFYIFAFIPGTCHVFCIFAVHVN
jgi:hypothetical protein